MFRALRAPSRTDRAWRLLAPLLVLVLALSAQALAPAPVEAGGSDTIAALRTRQLQAEADMRRADRQIEKLQRLRHQHKRLLKQARKQLKVAVRQRDTARKRAKLANVRLDQLQLRLARATQVRPDPKGRQAVDAPKLRKHVRAQRQRVGQLEAKLRKAQRKVDAARELKDSRKRKPTAERMAKRKAERERAEDRLIAAITAMLARSKDRAGRIGVASSRDFRVPVKGRVSQRYGCTGYYLNPPRGGCRHFHDGVDIAARKGKAVRASSSGYVAFAGYSPWDGGRRAFVVIIGHSRGYKTVYAHLQPRRQVRAGDRVERGQLIGRVGLTGKTSGPHVHWEVWQRDASRNPFRAGG
jgi:murein DD-endopeptidase MepM/ murein hydrolase activator NlpD